MCLDGTAKFEEEVDDHYLPDNDMTLAERDWSMEFPAIRSMNIQLLKKQIPCIIVAVSKTKKEDVRNLHTSLAQKIAGSGVKLILYVDESIDPNNLPVALWRFCNNLDPKRDSILFESRSGNRIQACMGLDGTTKTEAMDSFHRDWPNIIVADDKTIEAVNQKWSQLGLGDFIASPSLSFRDQLYGAEAVAAL